MALALSLAGGTAAQERAPDLTLTGELTRADHQTYREVPFTLPPGVTRLTLELDHQGREQRTVVDLGLRDPQRFRGWSGGNKSRITLAAEEATPSYLPGPLPPGEWRVILGVPNIRAAARSSYRVRVWFERNGRFSGFEEAPLKSGPGWYAGDLHTHTAHSDGACTPLQGGDRAPCPVFRTLQAAAAHGLDYVAVTDHNTSAQANSLRELQAYYAPLLALPGREITTFVGHANVIGPIGEIDFQVGGPRAPTINTVLAQSKAAGALVIVNHPASPSGEPCMGCGWAATDTDWRQVDAVEVVNGGLVRAQGSAEGPLSGVPFWEARLNEGHRLTAIGASDNHDASLSSKDATAIGHPRTEVWAEALSQPAILEGLRQGRAYVDVAGLNPGLAFDFNARAGDSAAVMGGELTAPAGQPIDFELRLSGGDIYGVIEVIENGRVTAVFATPLEAIVVRDGAKRWRLSGGGRNRWVRVNIRDGRGRLLLIGNPIYINRGR